jgi:hypothetical protein
VRTARHSLAILPIRHRRFAHPVHSRVPSAQSNQGGNVVIRTKMPVAAIYAAFRRILREEAPGMPITC